MTKDLSLWAYPTALGEKVSVESSWDMADEGQINGLEESLVSDFLAGKGGPISEVPASFHGGPVSALSGSRSSYIVDRVAIIRVHGFLKQRFSPYHYSYEELMSDVHSSMNSGDVDSVFLDVDSPGGVTSGADEAIRGIVGLRETKPIYAHISGIGTSAAYGIASSASFISAGASAVIGSVGTMISFIDTAGILVNRGATKVSVVADDSPYKNPEPGTSAHTATAKNLVNSLNDVFIAAIADARGVTSLDVIENYGKGDVFSSVQSLERRMVDKVMTYNEAFEFAKQPVLRAAQTIGSGIALSHSSPVVPQEATGDCAPSLSKDASAGAVDSSSKTIMSSSEYIPKTPPESSLDDNNTTENQGDSTMPNSPREIIQGLREKKANLAGQISKIQDSVSSREDGLFTEQERIEVLTINESIKSIDEQIEIHLIAQGTDVKMQDLNPSKATTSTTALPQGVTKVMGDIEKPLFSGPNSEGWSSLESGGYSSGALGLGEICKDLIDSRSRDGRSERLTTLSNSGHEGEKGGFFLPRSIQKPLRDASMSQLSLLDFCDTDENIDDYSFEFPVDDAQAWYPDRGIQARNAAEGSTAPASEISIGNRRLELGKVQVMVKVTDRLMKTVSALGNFVQNKASQALAWKISQQIAYGNGVNQAYGFMNSGALVTVPAEIGQTADSIVAENIAKMIAANSSAESSLDNLLFLIHPGIVNQTHLLESQKTSEILTIAQGGSDGFSRARPPRTLAGIPYRTHQVCKQPGDLGDIMLVDLKQYYAPVFRGGIELKISDEAGFKDDETYLKFTIHVGGIPYLNEPITSAHGDFVQSPFVTLAAR